MQWIRRSRKAQGYEPPCEQQDCLNGSISRGVFWQPIVFVALMLFIDGMGYFMSMAPQTRMFEDIVCRQVYHIESVSGGGAPTEEMCKEPAVQEAVANLFGWSLFFDGIPGLMLAMYYGAQADRQGRRWVLMLSMIGQVFGSCWVLLVCWIELPLKLVWLSSAFLLIGGGSTVTSAAAMMIITDASTESSRSSIFFYCQAALIVAELIGPSAGAAMMSKSLWLPLLLALGCTIITAVLAGTIPETLHLNQQAALNASETEGYDPVPEDKDDTLYATMTSLWRHTSKTIGFIFQHRSVLFLVTAFLVVDYSRQSLTILLQYLSTRYTIPIAKASYLLSFRAFAQLLTYIIILPLLDKVVASRFGLAPRVKDFMLSRVSILFLMICFAILVVAPNLWVVIAGLVLYTLGSGFNSFARSLLSSLVTPDMIGTLFTTLSMMDTLGALIAGPVVASTFSWSIRQDGLWRGMPFMVSFIMCGVANLTLSRVRYSEIPGDEPAHPSETSDLNTENASPTPRQ